MTLAYLAGGDKKHVQDARDGGEDIIISLHFILFLPF